MTPLCCTKQKLISLLSVCLPANFMFTYEAVPVRNVYLAPVQKTNERGVALPFRVL